MKEKVTAQLSILPRGLIELVGTSLGQSVAQTLDIFRSVAGRHWVVTFSGGKDSTLLSILAAETLRQGLDVRPKRLDVLYSDTLVEIPPLHAQALAFLQHLEGLAREASLPIFTHRLRPPMEERFWFCVLAKGYPPPHRAFWWCTKRLKIQPVSRTLEVLRQQNGREPLVVLTGVRFGESANRNRRLQQARAKVCVGLSECGQTLQYQGALAPIAHWTTCQVWDFLQLIAPRLGWPTENLLRIYDQAATRFGCWICTVVRQERALTGMIQRDWPDLAPLLAFRQRLLDAARDPDNRVLHPRHKRPGKFKLRIRKALLEELLQVQEQVELPLIDEDEVQAIRDYWHSREDHDVYETGG